MKAFINLLLGILLGSLIFFSSHVKAEIKTSADYVGRASTATKLTRGSLSIFVIDNGDYASGQAAIDAAPVGSVLFFGPKVGTWGNIVLKPDVDIVGLGAPGSTNILFQSISFSPTTGNVSQNTVYVSNLSASVASGSSTVVIGGTAPSRVRFSGCTFYKTAGSEDAISITNNQASSSVYIINSQINGVGSTGSLINTVSPFLKVVNTTFDGASKALTQTAGLTTLDKVDIEYAQTASVIDILAGSIISADSLFKNLGTNSTGINVSAGAVFAIDQATFDISTGTGYAVNGTGVLAYGRVTFANIPVINLRNVKFQSTLTIANYTLTPTMAP